MLGLEEYRFVVEEEVFEIGGAEGGLEGLDEEIPFEKFEETVEDEENC